MLRRVTAIEPGESWKRVIYLANLRKTSERGKHINDFSSPPPIPPRLFSWFRLFFRVWHVFLENSFRSSVIRFSLVKLLPSSFRLILLRIRDRAYVAPTIIRRRKSRVHNREESPMTHRRKVREKFCKNSRNRLYRRSDVLSPRESGEVFDDIQK